MAEETGFFSRQTGIEGYQFVVRLLRDAHDGAFASAYDRLILWTDGGGWSLDEDAEAMRDICRQLGVKVRMGSTQLRKNRCIHHVSQFVLNEADRYLNEASCRYSVSYYHGGPEDTGFEELFDNLVRNRSRLVKVHVSNSRMAGYLREADFQEDQIAEIPIGIRVASFPLQTPDKKISMRRKLKIPQDAFVVGSFQKDGVGWGAGFEPKLIKGPDLFVRAVAKLKQHIPGLHVLLSGPSRGYVKNELERIGVPYAHAYYKKSHGISDLYQALDCYLMSSRVEGGPKSILESMASGVPLVATNVGQGVNLMAHGKNAYVVKPEDVEGMVEGVLMAHSNPEWFRRVRSLAREVAEEQDYTVQVPLWRDRFLNGYVKLS